MSASTFILVALPSWLGGMARTLDLWATMSHHSYNVSVKPGEADSAAAWADWLAVGADFQSALDEYAEDEREAA